MIVVLFSVGIMCVCVCVCVWVSDGQYRNVYKKSHSHRFVDIMNHIERCIIHYITQCYQSSLRLHLIRDSLHGDDIGLLAQMKATLSRQ